MVSQCENLKYKNTLVLGYKKGNIYNKMTKKIQIKERRLNETGLIEEVGHELGLEDRDFALITVLTELTRQIARLANK